MLLHSLNLVEKKKILLFQKRQEIVLKRNNVSDKLKAPITKLENKIRNKRTTKKGKERKEQIVLRLFNCKTNLTFILSLYKVVLALFSKNMLFHKEELLIHKVYLEQINVVHTFLTCFIKPEKLVSVTLGKNIKGLEITKRSLSTKCCLSAQGRGK